MQVSTFDGHASMSFGRPVKGTTMQITDDPLRLDEPKPATPASSNTDALIALQDRTLDTLKGFAKMVALADPAFHDIAERFRALHARHADTLARVLADLGIGAEADGTLMGTVNETVITFRAFFDTIDEDVMDQVRSGEDWVLKSFDAAIAAQDDAGLTARLREMRGELVGLLAETSDLG